MDCLFHIFLSSYTSAHSAASLPPTVARLTSDRRRPYHPATRPEAAPLPRDATGSGTAPPPSGGLLPLAATGGGPAPPGRRRTRARKAPSLLLSSSPADAALSWLACARPPPPQWTTAFCSCSMTKRSTCKPAEVRSRGRYPHAS
ncbi:hypothetical protein BDA96_01G554800 [Sorghum bicolor]|uniref:Uncharacterized protein n=2 Tax=Sorghum bicolor TaxID=4558 RepID=A0A921V264_SORBI|nr:hypothetical protein BDA96_01G554800 [Sorghum bicolor]KXG40262.1 hypothetical protein SORBI_3001G519600 [Sorghum bicolor]